MNAGPTSARVYQVLRDLLLRGEIRPGTYLDPVALASELAASTTPVREALCRLTGEELLETRPGAGFMLPLLDELRLQDLYAWTGDIMTLTLRSARPRQIPLTPGKAVTAQSRGFHEGVDYADASARLFADIAASSSNSEHAAAMARANAQLHAVRMLEPDVLTDAREELHALTVTACAGPAEAFRREFTRYLRRRRRNTAELLRRRYR